MVLSVSVDFGDCLRPAVHYAYQRYFIEALSAQPDVDVRFTPLESRWLATLLDHRVRGAHTMWTTLAEYRAQHKAIGSDRSVRYTFRFDDQRTLKVIIDPSDTRHVRYPAGLDWCDLYFKTNRWCHEQYPDKVRPLPNANGTLDRAAIAQLARLRNVERSRDLLYWTKIWEPGADTRAAHYSEAATHAVVEHQLRLFEALAAVNCDKDLLAVVPNDLRVISSADATRRLQSCGVRCQSSWGAIDTQRLWQGLASAKLVFLRPGNHLCLSWRMHDLLAMGACVLYDGIPQPRWPAPLEAGTHYLEGGCGLAADFSLPEDWRYAALGSKVAALLADPRQLHAVRAAAAAYFDAHLTPSGIYTHLVQTMKASLPETHLSRPLINGTNGAYASRGLPQGF